MEDTNKKITENTSLPLQEPKAGENGEAVTPQESETSVPVVTADACQPEEKKTNLIPKDTDMQGDNETPTFSEPEVEKSLSPEPETCSSRQNPEEESAEFDLLVGDLEISILKDIEETNAKDNLDEISENKDLNDWYAKVKKYFQGLPEAVKGLDDEFTASLENARQELNVQLPDELKTNLENRMESLDLCLKMLKRLDRFYPRFSNLQEKVESLPELDFYTWDQDPKLSEMKLKDFPTEENRLRKNIETIRDRNYRLLRQKKGAIDELKNFFFEFMQNYFFPIIDGLDKGKAFFNENQSKWIDQFAENAQLVQNRFALYDTIIGQFTTFLSKFNIEKIAVNKGDPFDERMHDPIIVEADENVQIGQIIVVEVSCNGYKFLEPATREEQIVRLPQVVVMKK